MTDPFPPRVPSVPVILDGPVAARSRGRALRRRRAAVVGGSGAVSAVLIAAFALGGPSGQQTLRPAIEPSSSATAAPPDEPTATAAPDQTPTPSGAATAAPDPTAIATATASAAASPEPTAVAPTPDPAPTAVAAASPSPAAAVAVAGPAPTTTTYDASRQCDGSGPTTTQGWCSYYDGVTTAARGTTADIAATVCRMPARGTGTLRTADGQYADFTASGGSSDWRWSTDREFPSAARTFTVRAGQCLRFAVSWDLRADDGTSFAPGSYSIEAVPHVKDGSSAVVTTKDVIAFTIT